VVQPRLLRRYARGVMPTWRWNVRVKETFAHDRRDTAIQALDVRFVEQVSGQNDHRNVTCRLAGAQRIEHRKPIQFGHHQIEQDQIGPAVFEYLQCCASIARAYRPAARLLHQATMQIENTWIVVHDQNHALGRVNIADKLFDKLFRREWLGQIVQLQPLERSSAPGD